MVHWYHRMVEEKVPMRTQDTIREYILMVGESQGYLMMSVKEKLVEAGFEVETAADIAEIDKLGGTVMAALIYVDDVIAKNQQLLIYLKDKIAEQDIPTFVFGNSEDLVDVKKLILPHLIQGEYVRPINVKEMADEIRAYLDSHDAKKKRKILVVDDSGVMLHSIKGWLGKDYQVTLANSGLSAIKYMILNRPDLILMDYEMPVCDGRQTLEMIRSETEVADIPVIFLTGKGDKESIMKVMALKPEGYLLKSMKPYEIKKYIDDFFEKKKANVKFH